MALYYQRDAYLYRLIRDIVVYVFCIDGLDFQNRSFQFIRSAKESAAEVFPSTLN